MSMVNKEKNMPAKKRMPTISFLMPKMWDHLLSVTTSHL